MSHRVEKFTERTTVSFAQMKEELAQVDAKGHAVNDEELLPGYLVLAAPVFNSTGRMAAAISITLPADHSGRENRTSHYPLEVIQTPTVSVASLNPWNIAKYLQIC